MVDCIDFFEGGVVTTRAGYICIVSLFGARGGFCFVTDFVVSKGFDCFESGVVATRAGYVCFVAGCGTGGFYCFVSNFIVTEFSNCFGLQNFFTNCAFNMLRTIDCASCIGVNDPFTLGVAFGGNDNILCCAAIALESILTVFFTVCISSTNFGSISVRGFICLSTANSTCVPVRASVLSPSFGISVVLLRNNFLCNENFITYRALFTFFQTGRGAGCSYCSKNLFGVTLCSNNSGLNNNGVTSVALQTFSSTVGGTGSCYSRNLNLILVTCCGDGFLSY